MKKTENLKQKWLWIAVVALFLVILFVVLYTHQTPQTANDMTPTQACDYLDKVFIHKPDDVPTPSCGITLPEDMPMEYFEMEATAWSLDGNTKIDLFADQDIKPEPGRWVVFGNLEQYSKATCVMRIKWQDQVFAEKTVNLLNGQDITESNSET